MPKSVYDIDEVSVWGKYPTKEDIQMLRQKGLLYRSLKASPWIVNSFVLKDMEETWGDIYA